MARWYLTSSKTAHGEAQRRCQKAKLRTSGQLKGEHCFGEAYFKRVIDTPNLVNIGEDWICAAGTLIYNGALGEQALRDCFSDFVAFGVSVIQSKAIGHYAVAVKRGNEVAIFTDPLGALTLYYTHNDSDWFVSNSLHLCAGALSQGKIDSTKLLVCTLQGCLPGEDMFYSGIKRLFGTQLIRIDLYAGKFRVDRCGSAVPSPSWSMLSMTDALRQYLVEVRSVFRDLAAIKPIGLLGTGGLDSRTVLAALLDQGASPQMMYGVGNSRLTDSTAEDRNAARGVANQCRLPFLELDWSGNQPHKEETLAELFQTYGFKYEIYGAPDSFLRAYNGGISPYPKIFIGGYGAVTSNGKPWELKQASFSFEELMHSNMSYQGGTVLRSQCIANKAAYAAVYAEEARKGLHCGGFDYPSKGASLREYVHAKLFLYNRADARYLNFVNEFSHYVAPFVLKRLADPLLSIPFEYRAKDEFQVRLIHALRPDLIDLPLFSNLGPARIDRSVYQIVRDQVPEHREQEPSLLRRFGKFIVPSPLRDQARGLYRRVANSGRESGFVLAGRDLNIVKSYSERVMKDPLGQRWFSSTSEFTPKVLARIHQYLVGVNSIGYSE